MKALFAILLLAVSLHAQRSPRGHWSGIIKVPEHPLTVDIDIDLAAGEWIGSASMPEQKLSDVELENIAFVIPGKWTFRMKSTSGNPTFLGTISVDGRTMSGDYTQARNTAPFQLIRTGDAQVATPKSSPAVTSAFVGTWQGQIGNSLHLMLKMANDESGAKAVLINMDQGDSEIPVTAVEQTGNMVDLQIHMIGVEYKGEIDKDGTVLTGHWIQGGRPIPLSFRKRVER